MRWEPLAILVALLIGAGWLVFQLNDPTSEVHAPDGARTVTIRIEGVAKYEVAAVDHGANGETSYFLCFPGRDPQKVSSEDLRHFYGVDNETLKAVGGSPNLFFQIFKITNWSSLIWVAIGLLGQVAFFLRMTIQWLASEKKRESVVPEAFWWLSFLGGVMLFSYFIWRRDIVGVLGQTTGIVVYARNLRLIYKQKLRQQTELQPA